MRKKYYFCVIVRPNIIAFLEQYNIRYKVTYDLVSFSLWDGSPVAEKMIAEAKAITGGSPIITNEFAKSELLNANYLVVFPKKQCIDVINVEESMDFFCRWTDSYGGKHAEHEEQKADFAIAKEPPQYTQTAFWFIDTGFSDIFADQRILDLVTSNSLSGVEFKNVRLRNGIISQYLYQMTTSNIIGMEAVVPGHGEEPEYCPFCGKMQFAIDSSYQLHLQSKAFEKQEDMYRTERIFGEGIAFPFYIISQRFYRLIRDNKLTRNVNFIPVAEVARID